MHTTKFDKGWREMNTPEDDRLARGLEMIVDGLCFLILLLLVILGGYGLMTGFSQPVEEAPKTIKNVQFCQHPTVVSIQLAC